MHLQDIFFVYGAKSPFFFCFSVVVAQASDILANGREFFTTVVAAVES